MKIEYRIDENAYEYLQKWAEENSTKAKWSPAYSIRSSVRLKGYEYVLHTNEKRNRIKYNLCGNDGLIAKGTIEQDETGENDFRLSILANERENNGKISNVIKLFCTAYIHANSFMWHGNVIEKKYVASGKNDRANKIVTFRTYKGQTYAVPVSHHKSPEGVFSVRGHFRRMANGNVVWIDEYMKGLSD